MEIQVGEAQKSPCLEKYEWNSVDGYVRREEECFDFLQQLAVDEISWSNVDFDTTVSRYVYYYRRADKEGFLLYIVEDVKGKWGHADSKTATIQYCELKSL